MKKWFLIALSICLFFSASAQTFEEWTEQKKTQLQYLADQIAALKVYGSVVNKGYEIVQQGLNTIRQIRQGDFKLHQDYFASLLRVPPCIKAYSKVTAVLQLQTDMLQINKALATVVNSNEQLSIKEKEYVGNVQSKLLKESKGLLEGLILITTDRQLALKDNERTKRIDALYEQMLEHYQFTMNFNDQINWLILQRLKESKTIQTLNGLYGLDK